MLPKFDLEYLEEQSTDRLIDIIIHIGLPIPYYNFEAKVFVSQIPKNIIIYPEEKTSGVTLKTESFSFRKACMEIILGIQE